MDESKTKDPKAIIEEWVEAYSDDLYRWALHKTSSEDLAADLVQETFVSAMDGLDRFEGRSQPKSWLFSILKNKIVDHYRKKRTDSLDDEDPNGGAPEPHSDGYFDKEGDWSEPDKMEWSGDEKELLDDPAFLKVLDHCIEELPERSRAVLAARFFQAKKGDLICKEMGLSSSNYWQIVRRAKLMLRDCLGMNWFK